jgi:hypothetical protein
MFKTQLKKKKKLALCKLHIIIFQAGGTILGMTPLRAQLETTFTSPISLGDC